MAVTGAFHLDGGMAVVNRLVIRALREQGYRIDVLSLLESRSPDFGPGLECRSHCAFRQNKAAFVLSLWKAVVTRRYSFVFVDLANLAAAVAPLSRIGLCRYVLWLHGREVFPPRPGRKGRIGLECAWKLLASSEYTRRAVVSRYASLQVSTCEPALESDTVPQTSRVARFALNMVAVDGVVRPIGDRLILSVGRMSSVEKYKGQDWLLRAFATVCREVPDVQLLLAGRGDDFPRLTAIARDLAPEVQSRLFMPGYVDETLRQDLYRLCYVFAMPSLKEGFGLVYLEAMSHAKPCIAARAAAGPIVVRHGESGLIVDDPSLPDELAAALIRLLHSPEEARRMGYAGYEIVRSRHLYPHFRERLLHALDIPAGRTHGYCEAIS